MINPSSKTGFIPVGPKLGDYIGGIESAILSQPVNQSSDWRPFLPTPQWQKIMGADFNGGDGFDVLACVTFAGCQTIETLLNFQIKAKLIASEDLAWLEQNGYLDAEGSVVLSKRFTAKMSGTTTDGNTFVNVWNSLRNDGAIPDSMWPMPVDTIMAFYRQSADNWQEAWNLYYVAPPQPCVDLGKQFAARFNVQYEWLAYPTWEAGPSQLRQYLQVSPIEVATAVCPPWNTALPLMPCGPGSQHATMLDFVAADNSYDIFDHYVPFDKIFAPGYSITYAMRGVISGQPVAPAPAPFHYVFENDLHYGAPADDEVHKLQQALQFLTDSSGSPYMKPGVFGIFGPITAAALAHLQSDNGIADTPPGHHFGPESMALVNTKLAVA